MSHLSKPEPPTEDKRWRIVQTTMRRNGYAADALIETLHSVQSAFGYLDEPSLKYVAHSLNVPLSKVYGVATFYHLFTLHKKGVHTLTVCTGTACFIKGAARLLSVIENKLGIHAGETSKDGQVTLEVARCTGACGTPVAGAIDEHDVGEMTPEMALEKIKEWVKHDTGNVSENHQ